MSQLEQQLHRRNLETAWLMAAGWKPEHQEQLAELVVDEFITHYNQEVSHVDKNTIE